MTWVDIGLIVVILLGGWRGRRRGLGIEVCHTGGALLGLVVGFRVALALAAAIYPHAGVEQSIAYVVVFAATAGAIAGIGIALAPRVDALLARSGRASTASVGRFCDGRVQKRSSAADFHRRCIAGAVAARQPHCFPIACRPLDAARVPYGLSGD